MSGRYQLVRKLATGGMAEVFLAPWIQWHAGAMLEAALIAEEHSVIARLFERLGSSCAPPRSTGRRCSPVC